MMQKHSALRLIQVFVLLAGLYVPVSACNCEIPTICQAFSIAKAVFTGKLLKLERNKTSDVETLIASFEVGRSFKGKPDRVENVKIVIGSCDRKFTVGEEYFVYKQPPGQEYLTCDPTRLLSNAQADIKYASSLSDAHPIFTISGLITGVSGPDLEKIRITIDDGTKSSNLSFRRGAGFGSYSFAAKKDASYTVTVTLPVTSASRLSELGLFHYFEGNQIKYTTKFKPNQCDHRDIEIQMGKTPSGFP